MERTKFLLGEERLPESWYNVVGELPFELEPPLDGRGARFVVRLPARAPEA